MCLYMYPTIVTRHRIGKVYPFFVARQRFGKHDPAATNTRNSRIIAGRVCPRVYLCIPLFPISLLGNNSVKMFRVNKNCWSHRIICGPCRIKGN
jgi:hypothetical protein